MADVKFSFNAYMVTPTGQLVRVLEGGRIGTQRKKGEPTRFTFFCGPGGFFTVGVEGDIKSGFLQCDEKGFLHLSEKAETFMLIDNETASRVTNPPEEDFDSLKLWSCNYGPVLEFWKDGFKDEEVQYNYLMAAHKVKVERVDWSVKYIVPDGRGAWVECREGQSYDPKPALMSLIVEKL